MTDDYIKQDVCVICGHPAVEFEDEELRIELKDSKFCKECQDLFFRKPSERKKKDESKRKRTKRN
jgi:hypothetical protein